MMNSNTTRFLLAAVALVAGMILFDLLEKLF